jgi:hypothetical protein
VIISDHHGCLSGNFDLMSIRGDILTIVVCRIQAVVLNFMDAPVYAGLYHDKGVYLATLVIGLWSDRPREAKLGTHTTT